MKKFDKIIWETYKVLLEQDPNLEMPAVQPVDDLGAAAPVDDVEEPAADDSSKTSELSAPAEVALVRLLRIALFTEVPLADKLELEKSIISVEDMNEENAKTALEQIIAVLESIPGSALKKIDSVRGLANSTDSDAEIMGNLSPV